MGLAASQARYLALTARKSNVEFEGQMVNQQRTELANESAGIFAEMLKLENPTPPSVSDFYKDTYDFQGSSESTSYVLFKDKCNPLSDGKYEFKDIMYETKAGGIGYFSGTGNIKMTTSGSIQSITFDSFSEDTPDEIKNDIGINMTRGTEYNRYFDEEGYQKAMNEYNYKNNAYQKRISELSQRTETIQIQDRTLEVQLRQLDTEQEALQTEMESVKKVIEKNVDRIFKTFQD